MANARRMKDSRGTVGSCRAGSEDAHGSGNDLTPEERAAINAAALSSPLGRGLREEIAIRARSMTPADGNKAIVSVAVAVSQLLEGRGRAGVS